MKEKREKKCEIVMMCLSGLDPRGFFVKLCLFGKLWMVTGDIALVTVD